MRYLIYFGMCTSCLIATGCDVSKTRELTAQLQKLEAENEELQAENRELQSDLEAATQELNKFKLDQERLSALLSHTKGFVEKYGEALNVAKDLGLPELKDGSLDDLLNKLVPESAKEGDEQP